MNLQKAKLWGKLDSNIEIVSLTADDLDEALDVLDKSFFLHESVCIGSEINLPASSQARQELRELCRITAQDGVSLVAKELSSGKIVAVSFNKIQFVPANNEDPFFLEFRKNRTKSPQAQCLMDFMIAVDSQTDVFEQFHVDCVCELMFLATLPEYERRGIGRTLTRYTIELSRQLAEGVGLADIHPSLREKRPRGVTALFTSSFSQKVGASQGFTVLNTVPYTEFKFNGKTFAERVDPMHPNCQHVALIF